MAHVQDRRKRDGHLNVQTPQAAQEEESDGQHR
jgi:hypothetical protein